MSDFGFDDDFDLGDEDDSFGDYGIQDDPEPAPQISPRQKKLQAKFDQKVERYIQVVLRSKNATKRRKAAAWLGESGEPKAISALLKLYHNDKNDEVRETAAYALGMFKSLDKALKGSDKEQEKALELVEGIVFKGQTGSRLKYPTSMLIRLDLVLLVTFVVLLIVAMSLGGGGGDDETDIAESGPVPTLLVGGTPVPTVDNPVTVRDSVQGLYDNISSDLTALEGQLAVLQGGGELDCAVINGLNPAETYPIPSNIPDAYPLLDQAAQKVNDAELAIAPARTPLEQACLPEEPVALPEGAAATLETALNSARTSLDGVPALLGDPAAVVTATLPPSPTATPSPTITPTHTPTFDPSIVTGHVTALDFILSEMTGLRGHHSILSQYWQDVQNTGSTLGCREPVPVLPDDYSLPQEQLEFLPQELKDATDNVNLGLAASRDAWTAFSNACTNGTLTDTVNAEGIRMTTIDGFFAVASDNLTILRSR